MRSAERWAAAVADTSAAVGRRIVVDACAVLDRGGDMSLGRAGVWSPNRSCRLIRAADGWLAVNLPRADDMELVPAWLGREILGDTWRTIVRVARARRCSDLLATARLLGLAISIVGETPSAEPAVPVHVLGAGRARSGSSARVVDLTSMWAGPLCAALLVEAGAEVVRIESSRRPDTTRTAMPAFYARLNRGKKHMKLDFENPRDRHRLSDLIAGADIVVTSARPRAFEALGITPAVMMERNAGLIWVAITGHGWIGGGADRIAFGDDAAAAGGMLRLTANDQPRFLGDALADPITGLAAAAATFEALKGRGGVLIDAALARVAAADAAAISGRV